ncbi:MAG: hypothetical protein FWF51_01085 [Chitinivibrionia bacterium]|nr:hypothetical protein [Chitinivibrionia bacterium]
MKNNVVLILILFFGGLFLCFAQRTDFQATLELDEQQKEAFSKLKEESRAENSLIFSEIKALRGELLDESAKEIVDTAKINEIADEIGKLHSLLSVNMSKNIQRTKEILTEEQFGKFIEHRKSRNNKNFSQKRGQKQQKQ